MTCMKWGVLGLALVALAFSPTQVAQAVVFVFDNDTADLKWLTLVDNADPDPDTYNNWDVGGANPTSLPGAFDDVEIDTRATLPNMTGADRVVLLENAAGTIQSLKIGGGSNTTTLSLSQSASNLTVSGNVTLGADGARGDLTVANNNTAKMRVEGNIVSGGTGDNKLNVNNNVNNQGYLELLGNIDEDGVHRIDLSLNRGGNLKLVGAGPQSLYLDQFNVAENATNGNNTSWTLGPDKLVKAKTVDVGRNTNNTDGSSVTTTGTLNIFGGTVWSLGEMRVGNVGNAGAPAVRSAHGTVNVGDATYAGTLTVDGVLALGRIQDGSTASSGTLVVNNAGSVVTLNAGLEMGNGTNPLATATLTINDGLVTLRNKLASDAGGATVNLNGGTLHLADAVVSSRNVDTFGFAGGTLKFTLGGSESAFSTLQASQINLGATVGASVIDLAFDATPKVSTSDVVSWVGSTGEWDATATNKWDAEPNNGVWILPSQGTSVLYSGLTYTLLEDTDNSATIGGYGNAVLSAEAAADWLLDQTDANGLLVKVTRTNPTVSGLGPAAALIDGASSVVTRASTLTVGPTLAQSVDAARLNVTNGATLNASQDLVIVGSASLDPVDQDVLVGLGATLDVTGNVIFGGAAGADGGTLRVSGGTVTVGGNVVEGLLDGTPDGSVTAAQLFVDGGTLNVAGDITVHSFRVADATGSNATYTLGAGRNLTSTSAMQVGRNGTGTFVNDGGTVSGNDISIGTGATGVGVYTQNSGTSATGGNGVDMGEAAGANGTLNLFGGEFRALGDGLKGALVAGSTTTIQIGGSGLNPKLVVGGANLIVAQSGIGLFTITDGTVYQNANNLQGAVNSSADATLNFNGGVYDTRGESLARTNTNWIMANDGTSTSTVDGGTIYVAQDIQGANSGSGSGTLTINSGNVYVRRQIDTRSGSSAGDTINMAGGNLTFHNAAGQFAGAVSPSAMLFNTGDRFNWTGGTISGLNSVTGVANLADLGAGDGKFYQQGGTFEVVGGTTTIDNDYVVNGGATIDATFNPELPAAAIVIDNTINSAATATFNASAGNEYLLDIHLASPGDVTALNAVTWDGGGILTGTWDATKSNWSNDQLPSAGKLLATGAGVFTVVDSKNNLGGSPLDAIVSTGWGVSTSAGEATSDDLVVTNTADVAYGAVLAILGSGADVTRSGNLLISTGIDPVNVVDAAGLQVDAGAELAVSGNLYLGSTATGDTTQAGNVTIGGDLVFGAPGITYGSGGAYTVTGGTLSIAGDVKENAAAANVVGSRVNVDGGTLSVAGSINVEQFAVGSTAGSSGSFTLASGKSLTASNRVYIGQTVDNDVDGGTGELVVEAGATLDVAGQLRMGSGTFTLNGGNVNVVGNFTAADGNSDVAVVNLVSGSLTAGNTYWGDDGRDTDSDGNSDQVGDGVATVNIGVGGLAPTVTASQLNVGQWSPTTVTMDSGTVNVVGGNFIVVGRGLASDGVTQMGSTFTLNGGTIEVGGVGNNRTTIIGDTTSGIGTIEIKAGTASFFGEIKAGDDVGGQGTIKVGEGGGAPTVVVQGGNTEIPEDGIGTFELYSGTWFQNDNNFVQSQGGSAQSTVRIIGGTLDLTGQSGANGGQWNVNAGANVTEITGGLVRIGGALQLSDGASDSLTFTIGNDLGADPTVMVGVKDNAGINYRNNGDDTINFKSGTLDLTGGDINANATGVAAFNWSGGALKNVAAYNGSLTQSATTAASTLVIGGSVGAMNVSGDYAIDGTGNGAKIQMEIDGTAGAGVTGGHDQLTVGGAATVGANTKLEVTTDSGYNGPTTRGTIDEFVLVDATTLSGTFSSATYNGVAIGTNFTFQSDSNGQFVRVTYTDTEADVQAYFAHQGDLNGSLAVDNSDFGIFAANFNPAVGGKKWNKGDLNGDGFVNNSDFGIFAANYGWVYSPPGGGLALESAGMGVEAGAGGMGELTAVPEPGTLAMLGVLGLAGVLGLRRRRK